MSDTVAPWIGSKLIFLIFICVTHCSKLNEDNNNDIKEFYQYFDIASVETAKTTIKRHRKLVVCMFNSWAYWRDGEGKYDIDKHFDGDLCTHLVYRSILLHNETFTLDVKDNYLDLKLGYFKKVVALKKKYSDLKVILSVGGYDEGNVTFPRMVLGKKSRNKFIRNSTDFLKEFGFDGLNLDWQFPGEGNKNQFTALAKGLKEEFKKSGLLLTTTISGDLEITRSVYDFSEISTLFDLILLLAFDYHGPWDGASGHNAPLYVSPSSKSSSVSEILQYLKTETAIDLQTLILGVPLYGRPFRLQNTQSTDSSRGLGYRTKGGFSVPWTTQTDSWGYNEVCQLLKANEVNKNWKIFWDRSKLVPFTTNGSHWISFDNQDSIFAKVWMAREYNLKGIMAWSIDTDDFKGQCSNVNYPLLRTVNYALQVDIPNKKESIWPSLCSLYNSTGNSTILSELKPKIIASNGNMSISKESLDTTTGINCSAQGNPQPQIRWFKLEEVKITTEVQAFDHGQHPSAAAELPEYISPAQLNCGPHKPLERFEETELILTERHSGNYVCAAKNVFGTDKIPFSLSNDIERDRGIDLEIKEDASSVPWGWIVGIFIVIVNICLVAYYLKQRSNKKQEGLTKQELKIFFRGSSTKGPQPDNAYQEEGQAASDNIPYNTLYEIFQRDYEIDENMILGNGEFGIVFLGCVKDVPVAVKSTKQGAHKQCLVSLLSELKILIYLEKHTNIVNLVGASTINLSKGLLYIFVEYCPLGNLQNYLRSKCRGYLISQIKDDQWDQSLSPLELGDNMITSKDLLRWSHQVAKALEYLASKKVIHGDLAARNVLLFQKDLVKVTDFGLSRKLYNYSNYVKNNEEPLPWRWMAIESLRDLTFSHQSDVWSFGITIWEIFSLGETPYSGISWTTNFVDKLTDGLRIHKPKYATISLYDFLLDCWKESPQDRPKPEDLIHYFAEVLHGNFSEDYTKIQVEGLDDRS